MGQRKIASGIIARASLGACALALFFFTFSSAALAGEPFHPRKESLDVTGLNHACGVAVDSKGDLYASSAGTSAIKVYNPSHVLLTEIADANTPCGLAVTTTGDLYVSEKATGEVVRFKPNKYPFEGTPTYGSREEIDKTGNAKGIAVDPTDNRLYVAEGTKVAIYKADTFEANVGEGTLTKASGVAAFSYTAALKTEHYLWVAGTYLGADSLDLFRSQDAEALISRSKASGAATPDGSFLFGSAGASLAADSGNRNSSGECKVVGEQACTAGHLFLYDAGHKALDEFDASGGYLDRTANAAFADAEPTQVAIDRSTGANDGTLYATVGAGAGAKALAYGPLKAPKRETLKEPSEGGLSHTLAQARAVATDPYGNVFVAAANEIHIYGTDGKEITKFTDTHKAWDLALDSIGKVYVLDKNSGAFGKGEVTYYTPSKFPPESTTTYARHEPPIAVSQDFQEGFGILAGIAVDPGPGAGKDRLFVADVFETHEYDSAANGSTLLDEEFAPGVPTSGPHQSIAVDGPREIVYISVNSRRIFAVDRKTKEVIGRFEDTGGSKSGDNPFLAVDQANGHVIEYGEVKGAREYDAAGSFVAEFGNFTEGLTANYRVAVDSACALHVNGEGKPEPLDETTTPTCKAFDPANGTAYVAFDDTSASHPPYDLTAFGRLTYPPPEKHKLTVKKTGDGGGTVTSEKAGINCGETCSAEFEETEVVTLSATADEGSKSKFEGWSGCEAEPSPTKCEVTMSKAREVTAEFDSEGVEFELEVKIEGSGTVTSEPAGIECPSKCTAKFVENVKVTLMAKADKESEFLGWSGCDSVNVKSECVILASSNRKVTAEFGIEHPLLTVVKEGGGDGTVTSDQPGISCGATCSAKFDLGDVIILEVEADEGSVFSGWQGCDSEPSETECEVEMTGGPVEVIATFDALPQVIAMPTLPVLYDEATLRGEVNPSGLPTEYRFDYLTEEEYEANGETFDGAQHTPLGELASGNDFVAVEAPISGLEEGTEYRFRLRAMNPVGPSEEEGPPFATLQRGVSPTCANAQYRTGLSANLPDCRAYELVTPAQTNGLAPIAANSGTSPSGGVSNWLTPQRGEAAGERLSYFTSGTLPGFEGSGVLDGYRAEREAGDHPTDGWQSALFSPNYAEAAPSFLHSPLQLGVAADQLYSTWEIRPEAEGFPETLPEGVYLHTPTGFEAFGRGSLGEDLGALSRYVSAGGAHVVFTSTTHLEPDAPPAPTQAVYDRAAGSASAVVISSPPADPSPSLKAEFETSNATYAGASEDGAAVAFSVGGALYLHRDGATVQIANGPSTFAGISSDGQRVFYTATTKGDSPAALYACDADAGPCAGPGASPPLEIAAAGIFAGVSPDGSHAFFSSTAALTGGEENENGEEAQAGKRNLYAWDGTVHFIGGLTTQDFEQNAFGSPSELNLAAWTNAVATGPSAGRALAPTRSTLDGGAFVFQTHARLTPYDNEEVGEIYRYEPTAGAGERLLCVSCDPTGAAPSADALLQDVRGKPGDPIKTTTMIASLTEDGESVFFQSFDRLLPEDANEAEDVYEWQAKGTEGCTRTGGCLSLISSGQGEVASYLYAMSADGHDVFLQTKEKLVGVDEAGSPSIYDARVGGGIPEPAAAAPCQGDACQGQGSEPPGLPSPATTGAGESPESPPPPKRCAKGKHRVKGRCVAVKHKHHKRRHRRAHANGGGNR